MENVASKTVSALAASFVVVAPLAATAGGYGYDTGRPDAQYNGRGWEYNGCEIDMSSPTKRFNDCCYQGNVTLDFPEIRETYRVFREDGCDRGGDGPSQGPGPDGNDGGFGGTGDAFLIEEGNPEVIVAGGQLFTTALAPDSLA